MERTAVPASADTDCRGPAGKLTGIEGRLLEYLASHAGRVVSRDEILARVWHLDPARVITRTVDMHIAKLRGKLRQAAAPPVQLLTVRGRGYMLVDPGGKI